MDPDSDVKGIVEHLPTLTVDDFYAAAAYGAWLVKQGIHTLSATP